VTHFEKALVEFVAKLMAHPVTSTISTSKKTDTCTSYFTDTTTTKLDIFSFITFSHLFETLSFI